MEVFIRRPPWWMPRSLFVKVVTKINIVRKIVEGYRQQKKSIGFVPTMGCLHEGHLSLIRKCREENDKTIISIFINPKQFGKNEDYKNYPRDKKKDELLAKKEKVDIIFYSSVKIIYPDRYLTYVDMEKLPKLLCGKFRPGHFRGVITVVAKLLNIVSPNTLYLGQKDAQQAIIISQMVKDLNMPVSIRVLPTVRDADGLALSSRNSYLSKRQREQAPVIYQALRCAKEKIQKGKRDSKIILRGIREMITKRSAGIIEYVECVDRKTLEPVTTLRGHVLIAVAVWFGKARLIDNISVRVK